MTVSSTTGGLAPLAGGRTVDLGEKEVDQDPPSDPAKVIMTSA